LTRPACPPRTSSSGGQARTRSGTRPRTRRPRVFLVFDR
jgi:hypothetical protein